MCEADIGQLLGQFSGLNHVAIATDARKSFSNECRILLEKKKIPTEGWSDFMIEQFLQYLASMDSNNFIEKCGVGEREGRVFNQLVAKRHYGFSHGIGRSGDLEESQPKAVGSSILNQLTNALCLDLIQTMGIRSAAKAILVPMATGMTLSLCLLTLAKQRPNAKYVLWSRIDQKSCFKSMILSNIIPIIIDTVPTANGLVTDIPEFQKQIQELGADQVVAIFSTTSCFAPRQCDNILQLANLANEYGIPHLVNNAYGLQSKFFANKIEHAHMSNGRVDLFVQSSDKNLMVPVGGAIISGFDKNLVQSIARNYAGRASSSSALDVLITFLSMGKSGYLNLVKEREEMFQYLNGCLKTVATKYEISMIDLKNNPISMIIRFNGNPEQTATIGAMLFKRNVSGARVVTCLDSKTINSYHFNRWGCHSSVFKDPYLTVAAGIGMTKKDVDRFIVKFDKIMHKLKKSSN